MESESIPPKQRPPELMRGMIQRVSNEIAHFRAAHGDEPDVQNILSTALGVPRAQTQGCLVLSSLRKASADVGLGF
jgi:hypothetical protein